MLPAPFYTELPSDFGDDSTWLGRQHTSGFSTTNVPDHVIAEAAAKLLDLTSDASLVSPNSKP